MRPTPSHVLISTAGVVRTGKLPLYQRFKKAALTHHYHYMLATNANFGHVDAYMQQLFLQVLLGLKAHHWADE